MIIAAMKTDTQHSCRDLINDGFKLKWNWFEWGGSCNPCGWIAYASAIQILSPYAFNLRTLPDPHEGFQMKWIQKRETDTQLQTFLPFFDVLGQFYELFISCVKCTSCKYKSQNISYFQITTKIDFLKSLRGQFQ